MRDTDSLVDIAKEKSDKDHATNGAIWQLSDTITPFTPLIASSFFSTFKGYVKEG